MVIFFTLSLSSGFENSQPSVQPPGPPEPERPEGPQNTINVPSRQVHEPDSGPLQIDDQVRRHIYEYYSLI